jgi:hypothetical protein
MFIANQDADADTCHLLVCPARATRVLSYRTTGDMPVFLSLGFCEEHADELTGQNQPFGDFVMDKPRK